MNEAILITNRQKLIRIIFKKAESQFFVNSLQDSNSFDLNDVQLFFLKGTLNIL